MSQKYYRGEIYYIFPKDAVGSEQMGSRPGIIVSNDMGNEHSKIVEVVYLTTRDKKPLPTHVEINSARHQSIALCEQIETVSKERIGNYINSVTQNELNEIERALLVSLDINCNIKGSKKLEAWEKLIEEWENTEEVLVELEEVSEEVMEEIIKTQPAPILLSEPVQVNLEADPRYIQVCTQRDVYKELYMNLLKEIRKTA